MKWRPEAAGWALSTVAFVLVLAIAFVVALATPSRVASASSLQCDTSGRTIRLNSVARVFRLHKRGGHVYYGCRRRTGRVFRLARTRRGVVFLELPRLSAGYFAAEFWHIDSHESGVTLWDLSTGEDSLWGTGEEGFVEGDIAVTADGAVAWIDDGLDVWKADADGPAMIGSADFRLKEWKMLTLVGERLSWRHRGVMHSYLLRGGARDGRGRAAR